MLGFGPVASSPRAALPPEDLDTLIARAKSADWTGIQKRLEADPARVAAIRAKVRELDQLVECAHLSNSEKAAAKDHTEALLQIVEMPRPRWLDFKEALLSNTARSIYISIGCAVFYDLLKLILSG